MSGFGLKSNKELLTSYTAKDKKPSLGCAQGKSTSANKNFNYKVTLIYNSNFISLVAGEL